MIALLMTSARLQVMRDGTKIVVIDWIFKCLTPYRQDFMPFYDDDDDYDDVKKPKKHVLNDAFLKFGFKFM